MPLSLGKHTCPYIFYVAHELRLLDSDDPNEIKGELTFFYRPATIKPMLEGMPRDDDNVELLDLIIGRHLVDPVIFGQEMLDDMLNVAYEYARTHD